MLVRILACRRSASGWPWMQPRDRAPTSPAAEERECWHPSPIRRRQRPANGRLLLPCRQGLTYRSSTGCGVGASERSSAQPTRHPGNGFKQWRTVANGRKRAKADAKVVTEAGIRTPIPWSRGDSVNPVILSPSARPACQGTPRRRCRRRQPAACAPWGRRRRTPPSLVARPASDRSSPRSR